MQTEELKTLKCLFVSECVVSGIAQCDEMGVEGAEFDARLT